jgi:hypothetical protein
MRTIKFRLEISIPANQIRAQMTEECITQTPNRRDVAVLLRDSNALCLAAAGVRGATVEIVGESKKDEL